MPPIICEEEEEEEDMTFNLRVGFHERQRKCLSESIAINPTPLKRVCPKPTLIPSPVPVPPTTAATVTPEPDEKLSSIDDIAYHEIRRPFIVPKNLNEESLKCMTSSLPIQSQHMSLAGRINLSFQSESLPSLKESPQYKT